MHDIVLIGLNHNTAPVELRECIAFSEDDTRAALARLRDVPVIDEAMLLSTCNRVEVLLVSKQPIHLKAVVQMAVTPGYSLHPRHQEQATNPVAMHR